MTDDSQQLTARLGSFVQRHVACFGAAAIAVAWFLYLGYGATVPPTHISWMLRHDWAAYLWGASFYRNSAWALPLGNTPELFYPFGTSIGFTDANPWLALLLKPFSALLPLDFQYWGLWFLACFVLQAVIGTRIVAGMSDDKLRQMLGGALFAVTPLLPSRSAHIALSAFFFVTFGVYLHLKRVETHAEVRRAFKSALIMLIWAAGTHGYLSAMLLVLVTFWIVRMAGTDRLISARTALLMTAASFGATLLVYVLFGYLGWKPTDLTAEGFGDFSGDLTALINPQTWSRFFKPLPYRNRQWEGFLYLGTGVFFLLAVGLVLAVRARRDDVRAAVKRHWALALALALMWLYSLSSHVAFEGEIVLQLDDLYAPFKALTGIFRSSGRFAWPLHVSLIALGCAVACKLERAWLGRGFLLVALLLQTSELNAQRLDFSPVELRPLHDALWSQAGAEYRHLRLVPLQLLWVCKYDARLVNRLSYEAYRQKLTFNSGNFMRHEPDMKALCNVRLAPDEPLDGETIYVIEANARSLFESRGGVCARVEGLSVCAAGQRNTSVVKRLRALSAQQTKH